MAPINQHQPTAYDYVFPVLGGKLTNDGKFEPFEIYGTAFYIGNDFFVTCAHTINNASEEDRIMAIGYQNEQGAFSFSLVLDSETFEEENDSGIMLAHIPRAQTYPWLKEKLAMINDVVSCGFPYGFDDEHSEILIRAFKGHIMSVGFYNKFKSKPLHYELSYQCPRGLSGAPLIFVYKNQPLVCGMTIGDDITETIVYSYKYINEDDGKTTTEKTTEALHRGIAVQVESFLKLKSRLLNMTVEEYLNKENLLK